MSCAPDGSRLPGAVRAAADRAGQRAGRLTISTRLALVTSLLTFTILFGFATAVGSLTIRRIRDNFDSQVTTSADELKDQIQFTNQGQVVAPRILLAAALVDHAVIQVDEVSGTNMGSFGTNDNRPMNLGTVYTMPPLATVNGYRVATVPFNATVGDILGNFYLQYARPESAIDSTVNRVRLLLVLGVLAGSGLALVASLMIARRAMSPIARLTSTAAEIAATRDPSLTLPEPVADDEVAELARTLQGMLQELDAARGETEAALEMQRRFVADASHELRTPLTSVLANLELLADTLQGEQGDAARSALRSSRRMRRLVADLLLLARADAGRATEHAPTDLGQVVLEAVTELQILAEDHPITVDVQRVLVDGARDELHRVALNLIENAVKYTPPGGRIEVHTRRTAGGEAELVVKDNGPGVPDTIADRLFERFVRGTGDRGGSSGLGLAIVRAVAESHSGRVWLERPTEGGSRFVVRLPALDDRPPASAEPTASLTTA